MEPNNIYIPKYKDMKGSKLNDNKVSQNTTTSADLASGYPFIGNFYD